MPVPAHVQAKWKPASFSLDVQGLCRPISGAANGTSAHSAYYECEPQHQHDDTTMARIQCCYQAAMPANLIWPNETGMGILLASCYRCQPVVLLGGDWAQLNPAAAVADVTCAV